jgi:hypothetical protein
MARGGITVYLPRDLEARVRRVAKDQRRSDSSIVADAVKARYAPGPITDETLEERARRQITCIDASLSRAIGETLIVKEVLLLFVRVWLDENPMINELPEEAAEPCGEARFERFLFCVAEALAQGKSLAGEEPHLVAAEASSPSVNGEVR